MGFFTFWDEAAAASAAPDITSTFPGEVERTCEQGGERVGGTTLAGAIERTCGQGGAVARTTRLGGVVRRGTTHNGSPGGVP